MSSTHETVVCTRSIVVAHLQRLVFMQTQYRCRWLFIRSCSERT